VTAPKPYNPDKDTKDTRRVTVSTEQVGPKLWVDATVRPLEYLEFARSIVAKMPEKAGELHREIQMNLAQAQWSRTRGIYTFDRDLAQMLMETPIEGLQDDVFRRLPEWSVYLPIEQEMDGRWVYGGYVAVVPHECGLWVIALAIEASGNPAEPYYYSTVMFQTLNDTPMSFKERFQLVKAQYAIYEHLQIDHLLETPKQDRFDDLHALLYVRAAYLCTQEPDIHCPREPKSSPKRKNNNGPVKHWEVGVRFGNAFRKALADHEGPSGLGGERSRPRVHVRRAHWHTILSGPKDQARKREVRWFPPVIVNGNGEDLPTTIWRQGRA
jgi:hypothetical protein